MAKKRKKITTKKSVSKKPNHEKPRKKQANNKKAAKKIRTRTKGKNSSRKSNGTDKLRKKNKLSKSKLVNSRNFKRKVRSKSVKSSPRGKGIKSTTVSASRKIKGVLRVAKQNRKTWKELDFDVSSVVDINDKISLFEAQAAPYIKKQLKKRGGKPPRGIVVIVTDENGNTAGAASALTFVVNLENVIKFVVDFLKELLDNAEYFQKQINKVQKSGASSLRDILEQLSEENYGNIELNTIVSITIKFIY